MTADGVVETDSPPLPDVTRTYDECHVQYVETNSVVAQNSISSQLDANDDQRDFVVLRRDRTDESMSFVPSVDRV